MFHGVYARAFHGAIHRKPSDALIFGTFKMPEISRTLRKALGFLTSALLESDNAIGKKPEFQYDLPNHAENKSILSLMEDYSVVSDKVNLYLAIIVWNDGHVVSIQL